jgi:hypothetical protein
MLQSILIWPHIAVGLASYKPNAIIASINHISVGKPVQYTATAWERQTAVTLHVKFTLENYGYSQQSNNVYIPNNKRVNSRIEPYSAVMTSQHGDTARNHVLCVQFHHHTYIGKQIAFCTAQTIKHRVCQIYRKSYNCNRPWRPIGL